jgi:hypothetical protein
LKAKLWWDPIHEAAAQTYIMKDLGRKWRENRLRLNSKFYDKTKTREENIRFPPKGMIATEWASYIDYSLKEETKVICLLSILVI